MSELNDTLPPDGTQAVRGTTFAEGQEVGSYRITGRLGEGGMGAVYVAEHKLLGRKAAIKILLPELSRDGEMVERFFNEARATTSIEHPGIVSVFDFGFHRSGSAFIIMELLSGETLAARIKRLGRLPARMVTLIGKQIAGALGAAHARGIVHRDLKPDNIFLTPDPDGTGSDRVKVLDFGIAKLIGGGEGAPPTAATRTGRLIGTPMYMSPEQFRSTTLVDHRADIYALGCILYEMTTGRPPYEAGSFGDIVAAHLERTPPPPATIEPGVPPALDSLILRTMAKRALDRPQSMAEVANLLDGVLSRAPIDVHARTESSEVVLARPDVGAPSERGAVAPAPRGLSPGIIWAAAGLVVVAVVGGLALLRGGRGEALPPAALPAAVAPPAAPAPPPMKPQSVRLSISSQPDGAEVYRFADGVQVGRTPFSIDSAPSVGIAVYLLKLSGYRDERVELPADRAGEKQITLVPLPAGKRKPLRGGDPKKPGPKTQLPRPFDD